MSFNQKLKALRTENDMTQKYVAMRLNVARSTIAGYETKSRQPSHEKLTAIADLFGVSVDYLLEDDETITLDPAQLNVRTVEEQTLLRKYRKLSPASKKDLFQYISLLAIRDEQS